MVGNPSCCILNAPRSEVQFSLLLLLLLLVSFSFAGIEAGRLPVLLPPGDLNLPLNDVEEALLCSPGDLVDLLLVFPGSSVASSSSLFSATSST